MLLSSLTQAFETLPVTPVAVLLGALIFLVIILLGISLRNTVAMHRLTYPVYDYTIKKAEDEARHIVENAHMRAHEITKQARQDASQQLEKQKAEAKSLSDHFEQQLKALAEHNAELLERYTTLAKESYRAFDKAVEKESSMASQVVRDELDRLLEELRDEHGKLRRHFASQYQERLSNELAAAREAVDQYREAQLRLIDNRIIALVERAAALTLQKELSVKDHTDMIFRSLEEARKEGIL